MKAVLRSKVQQTSAWDCFLCIYYNLLHVFSQAISSYLVDILTKNARPANKYESSFWFTYFDCIATAIYMFYGIKVCCAPIMPGRYTDTARKNNNEHEPSHDIIDSGCQSCSIRTSRVVFDLRRALLAHSCNALNHRLHDHKCSWHHTRRLSNNTGRSPPVHTEYPLIPTKAVSSGMGCFSRHILPHENLPTIVLALLRSCFV